MQNKKKTGEPLRVNHLENRAHTTHGEANSTHCYSCGICTSSCPISLVPDGLDSRCIVHLENLGLLTIDRAGSSLWHCLDCHRCGNLCPNSVKPWVIIESLRGDAIEEGLVSRDTMKRLAQLKKELVAVLSNTLALAYSPESKEIVREWDHFARLPEFDHESSSPIRPEPRKHSLTQAMNHGLCLSCRECSNACPICDPSAGFDPLYFIRSYALGLPTNRVSLWSCLQCESCSQACSQSVQGHLLIKALQEEQETFSGVKSQIKIQRTRERVFCAYALKVNSLMEIEPDI